MAETTQFLYKHIELAKILMKDNGLHEGYWLLLVQFGFAALNVGPNAAEEINSPVVPAAGPPEASPAALVVLGGIGLQRAAAPGPMVFDASELNPKPRAVAPRKTRGEKASGKRAA
jgi:hypothetical protein